MLRIALVAFLAVVSAPTASADIFFDYRRATADQVSKFIFCQWISAENIAAMPAPAFAGFKRECLSNIKSFSEITEIQFSYIPPSVIDEVNAIWSIPADAFSGANNQQARMFKNLCNFMTVDQFRAIVPSVFAYLTAQCTDKLYPPLVKNIDSSLFQLLTPDAVGGFGSNLIYLSEDVFEVITADQLRRLSTRNGDGYVSACNSIGWYQVIRIPAGTWAAGITFQCFSEMTSRTVEAITDKQLMTLSKEFIGKLTASHTQPFANVCAGAQQFILQNFAKDAFQGLEGPCFDAMDDDALASLADWQLYALNHKAAAGFRSAQWKRFPAEKVNKLYAATLYSLSSESCRVMSAAQLESICRVGIAGLGNDCIAALPAELGKSLDRERLSQLHTLELRSIKAPLFRQISPAVLANISGNQLFGFNDEAFREMRPLQFKAIPYDVWSRVRDRHTSALNPLIAQHLQLDHLAAMNFMGWHGFTAMHLYYFNKRFGNEFLETATLDKITGLTYEYVKGWWRQAECLNQMYDSGLLSRHDGGYTPNWMVLLSRSKSVEIQEPVLPMTYLAGLRGQNISNIASDGVPFIRPTEFATLSASQIDTLCRLPVHKIRSEQMYMVKLSVISALKAETLTKVLSLLTCAQLQAITQMQFQQLDSRMQEAVRITIEWCQKPVNDAIAKDGDNGQRWSERKLGRTYELDCGIDVGKWEKEIARRAVEEKKFTDTYVEKQVPPVFGCPCNHTSCLYAYRCYTEPAATCQYVAGQSDQALKQMTLGSGNDALQLNTEKPTFKPAVNWHNCTVALIAVMAVAGMALRHYKFAMERRVQKLAYKLAPQV